MITLRRRSSTFFVLKAKVIGDFFDCWADVDWIIGNPPYSKLDSWLLKTTELTNKGFAYLLGFISITPKRMEVINRAGFGLTSIHLCKVFHWFGISAFCIWERGKTDIISYNRTVWR